MIFTLTEVYLGCRFVGFVISRRCSTGSSAAAGTKAGAVWPGELGDVWRTLSAGGGKGFQDYVFYLQTQNCTDGAEGDCSLSEDWVTHVGGCVMAYSTLTVTTACDTGVSSHGRLRKERKDGHQGDVT